jgi:hypothetical protein
MLPSRSLVRLALLLSLGSALAPGPSRAGAWLQETGAIYLKTAWIQSKTSDGLDCRGDEREVDEFGGNYEVQQVFSYVEWGARDWLTVLGSWSAKDQRISEARIPEYGTRSTGDFRLGARLPVRRGRIPVAAQFVASLPTYPSTRLSDPVADREQFLPAGSGNFEYEIGVQSGLSLYPLPIYANLGLSRRQRGGEFGDEWLVSSEVGYSSPRYFAKAEMSWILPTGDPCASVRVGSVAIHERVVNFVPEIGVRTWRDFWLNAGFSTVTSGRNTLDGEQFSLGFYWIRR